MNPGPRKSARKLSLALTVGLGLLAATAAQAQTPAASAASSAATGTPPPDLARCIATLRRDVAQHEGVRLDSFDRLTREVQDLRPVIERFSQSQPEFALPIWDYITRRVDAERIADGRRLLASEAAALARIEQRHGVDGATAVAVFGIETDYGRVRGRYPVIDATLSRACLRLDNTERRRHFFAALWLVQEGLVKPDEFNGSWAGAFGMTQFMPGTFRAYMDDGDGSGAIDIINSAADALGTTARYLKGLRWNDALPWGIEVKAPAALAAQLAITDGDHACLGSDSGGRCRNVGQWDAAGVTRIDGTPLARPASGARALPREARAALFMPAGLQGPAWLVTQNYRAIWQYNRADAYALSIGLLADQLRGEAPMKTPWPTDDPGISRAEFRELQTLLMRRGACDVNADGRDGPRTSAAISAFEKSRGLPETGRGGLKVLKLLRADPAANASTEPPCAGAASAPAAATPAAPAATDRPPAGCA